jgi:hypothetical protein
VSLDLGERSQEAPMSLKSLVMIAGLAALPVAGVAPTAVAQTSPIAEPSEPSLPPPSRRQARIEVHPGPLLFRRCVDRYELQNRPSGTVLFPRMYCWWVRG